MELNIPAGFLNGEIREGFYVENMMKRNWASMIKILAEIDRICQKYNIQYYADWGTLIGAVRHGGFVPWDDDIDITMLRPDYIRFCKAADNELPAGWQNVNIHTDENWTGMIGHVVNSRIIDYNEDRLKEFYGFPYIPGVDIFPLDYVSPNEEEDKDICDIIRLIEITIAHYNDEDNTEEEKNKVVKSIADTCGVKINYNGNVINQLSILQENLSMMYSDEESHSVALMYDHAGPRPLDVYPKEYYASAIMMPFEYIMVPVPVGYEKILERKYGEDWRTPVLCTSSHIYPYYKEQQNTIWKALGVL